MHFESYEEKRVKISLLYRKCRLAVVTNGNYTTCVVVCWVWKLGSRFREFPEICDLFHFPVSCEISELRNFWLHAMYACTEWYSTYQICWENLWLGLRDSFLGKCVGLGQGRPQRGGQWCPAPPFHVWPPDCCMHVIQYFLNVDPLLVYGPSFSFLVFPDAISQRRAWVRVRKRKIIEVND